MNFDIARQGWQSNAGQHGEGKMIVNCRIACSACLLVGALMIVDACFASQAAAEAAVTGGEMIRVAAASMSVPRMEQSTPADGSKDAAPSDPIRLRFNDSLDVKSVTNESVTLIGPEGAVPAEVRAEHDRVSLKPRGDLFPKTSYTLFVKGVTDARGVPVALTTITFTTAAVGAKSPSEIDSGALSSEPYAGARAVASTLEKASGTEDDPSAAGLGASEDPERWLPTAANRDGLWRTGRPLPPEIALRRNEAMAPQSLAPGGKPRQARAAGTAVTGIVLRQNDQPLANVTVSIGGIRSQTAQNGEFVLAGVPAGRQELVVDGRNASKDAGSQFGYFVLGVSVQAGKSTDMAPIYLPKILSSDWVDVPSPVPADTVVTTPLIPGMEIRIPKGAVLRDREGKLVTKIAMVPMPLDRMPFAFPENAPVFMSVQPGGVVVQGLTPGATSGITVRYPNQTDAAPGTRVNFWTYNTDERGWQVYGEGQVTPESTHVVPDVGVSLYESIGFSYSLQNPPPPPDAPPPCGTGCCGAGFGGGAGWGGGGGSSDDPPSGSGGGGGANAETAGDPVDCKSGLFVLERPDVSARGIVPVQLTRTYRPGEPTVRAFGYGQNHRYAMYLRESSQAGTYTQVDLVLADGSYLRFNRTSPGTGAPSLIARHEGSASEFYGAVLAVENSHFVVTTKNGTKYAFTKIGGKLDSITDRVGNTVIVAWTGGQIARLTAAGGRYLDFTYDSGSRITKITDIAGRTWDYTYSMGGYLTRVTYPDGLHEDYSYDTSGRMLTVTNRKGVTIVTNVYDVNGRVSKQTLADGAIYTFTYVLDAGGKVVQTDVVDPRGHVKRVTYGPNGYKASVTRAYGTSLAQTTTYERDSTSGFATAIVDAMGRRTELQRDAYGNLTQRTRLAGTASAVVESFTYTGPFNRMASYVDPLGKTTTFTYDSKGNLLKIADPLSHSRSYTYNDAGQVLTIIDAPSMVTRFNYDATGDLRSVIDPLNRATTYYIDSLGRSVGSSDPLGRKSLWTYDAMGRVIDATDLLGQKTNFAYDDNGNLAAVTDPNGGTTQYRYDDRGRRTERVDALNQSEYWTYDGVGNLLIQKDRKGQTASYEYDELDRNDRVVYADSTLEMQYDTGGRMVRIDDSISGVIIRTYDGLDRLAEEQTPQGTVSYLYDVAGRRTQMTAASQPPITYTYDDANRLDSIAQGNDVVNFAYDAANRRTRTTMNNTVTLRTTYAYDDASQLKVIGFVKGNTILGTINYTYDRVGQRNSRSVIGFPPDDLLPAATPSINTFDLNNRQTQAGGLSIGYDSNGDPTVNNATQPAPTSYVFDARHRLVEMKQAGSTIASFQYDPFGRRTRKTIGTTTTNFLYDGDNSVQETLGASVTPILTGLNVDERYARAEGADRRYFLTDVLGSTVALVDGAGGIQKTYSYEPYGEMGALGSNASPYQYTGRENDGTGLYYYRARYYSPSLRRFISEDPIGLKGGLNGYIYVNSSPLNFIDPFGLEGVGPWTFPPGSDRDKILCGGRCGNEWLLCQASALSIGVTGGLSCTYLCIETRGITEAGGTLRCPMECGDQWGKTMNQIQDVCNQWRDECLSTRPCEKCSQ